MISCCLALHASYISNVLSKLSAKSVEDVQKTLDYVAKENVDFAEVYYKAKNKEFKMNEKVQTMVEFENEEGFMIELQRQNTLNILSDIGPVIPIDIDATTNIMCDITSTFESSGVNQTLHKITLDMNVDVYVGNPIRIESIPFKTSYEIAQTLIVGSTPSAYGTISSRY